jgi:hypothetical protein
MALPGDKNALVMHTVLIVGYSISRARFGNIEKLELCLSWRNKSSLTRLLVSTLQEA